MPSEPKPLTYGAFWASLAWRGEGFDEHALTQRYRKASVMIGVLPIGRPEPGAAEDGGVLLEPEAGRRGCGARRWHRRLEGPGRVAVAGMRAHIRDQISDFEQLALARYGHHTLAIPAGRRLAIIGDAAHSTSPQLGQGANMALLDAAALAHALATAPSVEDALAAYAQARRWHVRVFQALSYAFTPFYQSDGSALPFIRDTLVATIARMPPVPQFLASMVAGTVVDPFRRIGMEEWRWEE